MKKDLNKRYTVLKGANGEEIIVKKPFKERFDAWVSEHPAAEKILLGSLIGLGAVGGFALGSNLEKKKTLDRTARALIESNDSISLASLEDDPGVEVTAIPE